MNLRQRFSWVVMGIALCFTFLAPKQVAGQATLPTCPGDPEPADPTRALDPQFLGMVANELMIPIAYHANLAFLAQQYRQAGVGHARVVIDWAAIEPHVPQGTQHRFDWGYTDLQVNAIARAGIRTLGIIANTPVWASTACSFPDHKECPAVPISNYENFVQAVVGRYGPAGTGQIRDWEIRIENKANNPSTQISKETYVVELNAAFAVIKNLDPGALVWGPEIAFLPGIDQNASAHDWVDYVIDFGHLDVFSIHLFPNTDFSEFALARTREVCQKLNCLDPDGIPLAVTAMAAVAPNGPEYTGPMQAANLQNMYTCAWAGGARHAMWFSGTQWRQNVWEIPCDTVRGIFRYVNIVNPTPEVPWTCQPTMNSNSNRVVPKSAYWTLDALGDIVTATEPVPPAQPYGILGVSSNPCNLSLSTPCPATLYWYSTDVPQAKVQLWWNGNLKVCAESNTEGSKAISHAAPASRHYKMYAADDCSNSAPIGNLLAEIIVTAAN